MPLREPARLGSNRDAVCADRIARVPAQGDRFQRPADVRTPPPMCHGRGDASSAALNQSVCARVCRSRGSTGHRRGPSRIPRVGDRPTGARRPVPPESRQPGSGDGRANSPARRNTMVFNFQQLRYSRFVGFNPDPLKGVLPGEESVRMAAPATGSSAPAARPADRAESAPLAGGRHARRGGGSVRLRHCGLDMISPDRLLACVPK